MLTINSLSISELCLRMYLHPIPGRNPSEPFHHIGIAHAHCRPAASPANLRELELPDESCQLATLWSSRTALYAGNRGFRM